MHSIPSAEEQKKIIDNEKKIAFKDDCYIISKDWWNDWQAYVNSPDYLNEVPNAINNFSLVCVLYFSFLFL